MGNRRSFACDEASRHTAAIRALDLERDSAVNRRQSEAIAPRPSGTTVPILGIHEFVSGDDDHVSPRGG
jgi:hypothetical protein